MPAASPAAPAVAPEIANVPVAPTSLPNGGTGTETDQTSPRTNGAEPPQHMRALAYANRVRLARASLKRSVKAGQMAAAEVVRECPWEAETMTIAELLRSQRRWGRTRARKFLSPLALNENRTLGRLTTRQRELLAAALDAKTSAR